MKGLKLKWPGTRRLRGAVVLLSVVGAAAGSALIATAPAQAVVGTDPTLGTLTLSPSSGPTSDTVFWGTSDACPSGFQNDATLFAVDYGSSPATFENISGTVTAPGSSAIPVTQTLDSSATIAQIQSLTGTPNGGSDEWVVGCETSATGASLVYYQDILVTYSADGSTFTTSAPTPAVSTTTSMVASPNPVSPGSPVTLTATVAANNSTAVTGSVTFMNGSSVVNTTPATVSCTSATPPVCTASYTITGGITATTSFTAVFTPGTSAYTGSTSAAYTENINAVGTTTAPGTIPVSVTITATGSLTVTIPTGTAVLSLNSAGTSATGSLGTITVTDTRNTVPGFAVYGQEVANFTGSNLPAGVTSASIPNTDLGWAPSGPPAATLADGTTVGPTSTNIGAAPAVLLQALGGSGTGVSTADAFLTLTIPAGTPAGTYTGGVDITYISVAP
jgi:trimeric autotransporter adhesin